MAGKKGMKHFSETIIKEVLRQRSEGRSYREISDYFGFQNKRIAEEIVKRHNKKQRKIALGIVPKKKGRPRKYESVTEEDKDTIIKQLKMENELLKSFLSEVGRR